MIENRQLPSRRVLSASAGRAAESRSTDKVITNMSQAKALNPDLTIQDLFSIGIKNNGTSM
jgi:hypothetical protein